MLGYADATGRACQIWPLPVGVLAVGLGLLLAKQAAWPQAGPGLYLEAAWVTLVATGLYALLRYVYSQMVGLGQNHYLALQHNPLPLLIADGSGQILNANPAAQALYGYTEAELKTWSIASLHARPSGEGMPWPAAVSGTTDAGLFRIHRPDHDIRWVQVLLGAYGQHHTKRHLAVVIDKTAEVTGRQEAAGFARQMSLANPARPDGYLALDHEFRVLYMNATQGQIARVEPAAALGRSIFSLQPQLEKAEKLALLQGLGGALAEFEKYVPHLDRHYRVAVHPSPTGLAVLSHDVTAARRRAKGQATLARQQAKALDQASDCIWIVSRNYEVQYSNPAYQTLRQDLLDKPEAPYQMRSPVVMPRQPQGFSLGLAEAFAEAFAGNIATRQGEVVMRDGSTRAYQAVVSPITNADGEVTALFCVGREITAAYNQEQALRKQVDRLKSIAWFQSLEVRGPLARIMGILQILPPSQNAEQAAWLQQLTLAAKQLDDATRSILHESEQSPT